MSTIDGPSDAVEPPDLSGRLAVSDAGDGFAYVPGHVLVDGFEDRSRVMELLGRSDEAPSDDPDHPDNLLEEAFRVREVENPLAVTEQLRAEGRRVQPEHVLVAHGTGCGGGCGPHPSQAYALMHGAMANPMYANPMYANPMYANPFVASLFPGERLSSSTAVPARELDAWRSPTGGGRAPTIVVLDTGIAGGGLPDEFDVSGLAGTSTSTSTLVADSASQRPGLLAHGSASTPARINGVWDVADMPSVRPGSTTPVTDDYLDPVAGHGTFIAGIIEQLVPGCTITVDRVVDPFGYVDEGYVIKLLNRYAESARAARSRREDPPVDMISMSFGGHLSEQSGLLRLAIARASRAGIVLVASAGNEGSCVPNYPAAFDTVTAVGAIGPNGPAPWSNFGPWVDACAPGVDLVSSFFKSFDGALPMVNGIDPDRFEAWARWSGTSFAGPVVVSALAREMIAGPCDASEAVNRVIRARHLMRIPCLGTIVNI